MARTCCREVGGLPVRGPNGPASRLSCLHPRRRRAQVAATPAAHWRLLSSIGAGQRSVVDRPLGGYVSELLISVGYPGPLAHSRTESSRLQVAPFACSVIARRAALLSPLFWLQG